MPGEPRGEASDCPWPAGEGSGHGFQHSDCDNLAGSAEDAGLPAAAPACRLTGALRMETCRMKYAWQAQL